jgi:2-polyprenyl-3-methyl-5-hydroxy-6-metoxy-1,4-benzoquinol methylase
MYGPAYFEERHNYFFTPAVVEPWMKAQNGVLHEFHQVTGLLHQFGKQGKLLDVGCATGVFLALARDAGWEPYGVDISSYATAFAQERLALKNVMAGTLREVHFPAAFFDAVTLLDVFEHLPEPLTELYEIHRILKKGGLLLINTPNEQSLLRRVARLLYLGSLGKLTYPVEKLYHAYHLCSYTQERLEGVLKDCGFTITWAAKKPIGGPKGRISPLMRRCLMTFAWVEKLLNMEYELLVVAQKVS